jgi:hypothetical protein
MPSIVKAAFAYVTPVFIVAFAFGALRVTLVAPYTGPLVAVALEVPLVLAVSWIVAGHVLRHWPLAAHQRPAMGALAFLCLMLAEGATALALGQSVATFFAAMATPPGLLGLVGQIGFGLIPLFRP